MFRGRLTPAGGTTVIRQRPGSAAKEKVPVRSVKAVGAIRVATRPSGTRVARIWKLGPTERPSALST